MKPFKYTPEQFLFVKAVGIVLYVAGGVVMATLLSHHGEIILTFPVKLLANIYAIEYGQGDVFTQDTINGVSIGLLYTISVSGVYELGQTISQYGNVEGRTNDSTVSTIEYVALYLPPLSVGVLFLMASVVYVNYFGGLTDVPTDILVGWEALLSPHALVIGLASATLGFTLDRIRERYFNPSTNHICE